MNLFGMADATEISDNPWEIKPNTYRCDCIDATMKEKDDGNLSLKLVWQINEPDNEFHTNKVTQFHTIINKKIEDMDPDEKKSMKFYKLNIRRAFDLSETEMNTLSAQDLLGRIAYVTVVINDKYTNVQKALCERLYDEEMKEANAVSQGMGV